MKKLKYSLIRSGTDCGDSNDLNLMCYQAKVLHNIHGEHIQVIQNYGKRILLDLPFKSKKCKV